MTKSKLQVVDTSEYYYLSEDDQCLCWGRYHSGEGFKGGRINQIILNIKKSPLNASQPSYRYKKQDIEKVGRYFAKCIKPEHLNGHITLVPIPPSKAKDDPAYDDRMLQICNEVVRGLQTPQVLELLKVKKSLASSHSQSSGQRTSIEDLKANLVVDCPSGTQPRSVIILVDDVLTTGRHFVACKATLAREFPDARIVGLFIGRVDHQASNEEALRGFGI